MLLLVLVMVAWTIDLARYVPELREKSAARDVPLAELLIPYMWYRTVDIVTRLLPMACFFGAFVGEIYRRAKMETVILSAAGASPLRMLAGAVWLGVCLGLLQGMLESKWRPAAVWAQVDLDVGAYAHRFHRGWMGHQTWLIGEDIAAKGEIYRASPPEMRDVMIFSGLKSPVINRTLHVQSMTPGSDPFIWNLSGVTAWEPGNASGEEIADFEARFTLVPQMLTYYGVSEYNLPTRDLWAYAALPEDRQPAAVATALWRRATAWFMPVTFILLGISLVHSGFEGRRPDIPRLVAMDVVGYILVVSVKIFWALGEHATLPAPIACSAAFALSLLVAVVAARGRTLRFSPARF